MKLAATILSLAAAVSAQASSSTTLTAFEQCLQKTCPSNIHDVNCQAACLGLPNPNASMIADTAACYAKCPNTDQQAQIDCKNKCDQIYNPSGSVISNHLTPDGVTATPTTSSTKTGTASSTPKSQSSPATNSGSNPPKSSDTNSGGDSDSDSGSDSDSSDNDSSSKDNAAATFKVAFSAVAVVVAAAALF
ncbi:hypothetical protein GGI20_002599 [Coemansia sp. BCRC 34301]|nr:hypothetical protein GGI20_002599 [Coemansia sp. BCRC 34301]